jgi:adenosylcobyric acid synthase
LGERIEDEEGIDIKDGQAIEALGILPVETSFVADKRVRLIQAELLSGYFGEGVVEGYEIHLGRTEKTSPAEDLLQYPDGKDGVVIDEGRIAGCYLHNIFHNDGFRAAWLNMIRKNQGFEVKEPVDTLNIKEKSFKKLAEICRENLDMDYLFQLVEKGSKI